MEKKRKVAFVICNKGLMKDDELLKKELESTGVDVDVIVWDENNVMETEFDVVLVRTVWDYQNKMEKFCEFLEVLPKEKTFNNVELLKWNIDKRYLTQLKGTVPSEIAHSIHDVEKIAKKQKWENIVVKPCVGSLGENVVQWRLNDDKKKKHLQHCLNEQDHIVQEFIPSIITRGEISMIYFDGDFSHAVRKVPCKGDFKVQGGMIESYDPDLEMKRTASKILQVLLLFPTFIPNYSICRFECANVWFFFVVVVVVCFLFVLMIKIRFGSDFWCYFV